MTTADLLAAFPSRRALVIGDVHRISPEAPVPVVQATEERHVAGGAANVAHNLAASGVRASVFGTPGTDETGRVLAGILEKNGVAAGLCPRRAGTPTIVKTRVVARHQQLCRTDHERGRAHYDPLADPAGEAGLAAAAYTEESSFEIFNLGGSATTTLNELVALVEAATDRSAIVRELPDQPGDVPQTYADVSKAEILLGYYPQTAIREGVAKYLEWYRLSRFGSAALAPSTREIG